MNTDFFTQTGFRCKMDWGRRGAQSAAARGDILVIVDTLRFSTTAATAIHHGALVYPCLETEDIAAVAEILGFSMEDLSTFSLSPSTFFDIKPGTRVPLASLNGAVCSRYGREAPHLFVGALVNAQACASAVNAVLSETSLGVTVIACGERWDSPSEDGTLRMAIEDYLGAGAIITGIICDKSPEALVSEAAFTSCKDRFSEILWDCCSGRELRGRDKGGDVTHAARLDIYNSAAVLRDGFLMKAE